MATAMEASDATGIPLQEEQPERDDWVEIRRRRSKKVKPQNTEATISVSQPTPQRALTRQPRLPPLPRDDFKIIIRPRGALNLANLETIHLSRAIAEKTRQHTRDRPNSTTFQVRMDRIQNIAIASTPSENLARHIRDIPTLRFGDNEYEVTAYIAAPDDSARGVVRGIPPETTGQELIDNLYSPGYEVLSARMIGKTSTALITFTGKQLPKYVIFEHAALPCSWYLPTRHACYICHEIGHRADVCPNPDTVKCVMCGVSNPTKGHECTPRCALCTGAHPTGSKECPKKLAHRPPTSVSNHHRRRKDTRVNSRSRSRSRGPQRTGPRQRSSSRPRSNSRTRSSNPQCDKAPAALCQPTDNNRHWEEGTLPAAWKHADIILIPKTGKPPKLENLRPISLTSCIGKLFEHVILNRLQPYVENNNLLPPTIFGFRPHLSTQDILLQLHEDINRQVSAHSTRAILTLDLKGAFDNVSHDIILTNLSDLNCGQRTFAYIQAFLQNRTATIGIGDLRTQPLPTPNRGTPQGAVLSPMLFNVAMMKLPAQLAEIEGVYHALYADDITIWATSGSDGEIQDALQRATDVVQRDFFTIFFEHNPFYGDNAGTLESLEEFFLTSVKEVVLREDSADGVQCAVRAHRHFHIKSPFSVAVHGSIGSQKLGRRDDSDTPVCLCYPQFLVSVSSTNHQDRGMQQNDTWASVTSLAATSVPLLNYGQHRLRNTPVRDAFQAP
ncbi:uncharacterized protein ISCGN_027375 [Ixodes scapularis]